LNGKLALLCVWLGTIPCKYAHLVCKGTSMPITIVNVLLNKSLHHNDYKENVFKYQCEYLGMPNLYQSIG